MQKGQQIHLVVNLFKLAELLIQSAEFWKLIGWGPLKNFGNSEPNSVKCWLCDTLVIFSDEVSPHIYTDPKTCRKDEFLNLASQWGTV